MSNGGKGSSPRPFSVDQKTFAENWGKVFRNQEKLEVTPEEDEAWKELEKNCQKKQLSPP
ncbi:MAG: hypothetical protein EBU90_09760 [Proteobacteria bacterium]|nr:hypothetical protein [Pseudomonadota bacterium]NBP14538.1 hypothetical protein [bacterium]